MSTGWAVRAVGIDAHQVPPCMLLVLSSVPSTMPCNASRVWEPPPIHPLESTDVRDGWQRLPDAAPPEGRAAPEEVVPRPTPSATELAAG